MEADPNFRHMPSIVGKQIASRKLRNQKITRRIENGKHKITEKSAEKGTEKITQEITEEDVVGSRFRKETFCKNHPFRVVFFINQSNRSPINGKN
jgi:hypothetical protein